MDIRDLLRQGMVEYVGRNEENIALIAVAERDLEIAIKQGLARDATDEVHASGS
jgi:hypothetical protein